MSKGRRARADLSVRASSVRRVASNPSNRNHSTQPDDTPPQRALATVAHERAILESALDCIITIDARGAVVEFNPAAERAFGYRRDDVLGKEMAQFIVPPALREQHRAGLARYLATGVGALIRSRVEVTAMRSDGSEFPVELAITPATSNGEMFFVAYLRDITERKRAEVEHLRLHELERRARADAERRERQLRAVFDAMTDGVAIYGEDGRIGSINPALRRMIGSDKQPEYEALPLSRRPAWLQLTDVTGRLLRMEQWPPARVLNGEVLVGVKAADIIAHTLDGREIEFSVTGAPMRDDADRVVGAVCVYHDIAARRLTERQTLTALHTLMRCADVVTAHTTSETTADLLARIAAALLELEAADFTHASLVDAEGHLTPAGIFGVSPEDESVWRDGLAHFDPSNVPHLDEVAAFLSTGRPLLQHFDADTPLISTATVTSLRVRAAITGPVLVDGAIVGLLTISRTRPLEPGSAIYFAPWDVDLMADVGRLAGQAIARARLGEQLTLAEAARLAAEEAARQRDEFLSIASHELKTPVTSLKLNLQLAQRRLGGLNSNGGSQSIESLLGTLLPRTNDQVDRLTRLIDDLLDVSRIATEKLALRLEPCDLTEIVNLVVREQRQHNPTRVVSFATPPEAVRLCADPDRIGQVITNYLTNALKYSPEETAVEVRVVHDDAVARVDVRDFGPGLLATEHTRIWERFYRAPEIDVQAGSGIGLGLGLYICKNIIERHGGEVGVESAPGAGSRFWFTVPLLNADSPCGDAPAAP